VLAAVSGVREGIGDALALVPRLGLVVSRIEQLLDRVGGVVDRVDGLVDRADAALTDLETTRARADTTIDRANAVVVRSDAVITRVGETQDRADAAIGRVQDTQQRADVAIGEVDRTTRRAAATLTGAAELVGRLDPLLGAYEQPLATLAPAVRRLAETMHPDEVTALITIIDRLPRLLGHLDDDVLPVLESLDGVGTDVHDLLDTVQDLRQVVKGFPGSRLFRRRGAEEIAEEEAREQAEELAEGQFSQT
jgi:hypothetical protein